MADYDYQDAHVPATRLDRVRRRPFEHGAALLNCSFGTLLAIEAVSKAEIIGVYRLPPITYYVLAAFMLLAGGAALAGLQWPRRTMSVGWGVERIGWLSSFLGWLCTLVIIVLVSPFMFFGFLISLYMLCASALRFDLLRFVEGRARSKQKER